jgi:hypothetical protein
MVVPRLKALIVALLVQREPNFRVRRHVVYSGSYWVARTSQTHARRAEQRDREAGADEAGGLGVPFGHLLVV